MSSASRRLGRRRPITRPVRGGADPAAAGAATGQQAMPCTAQVSASALAKASARSSTSTAPASTTTPARPAAAACSMVRGPMAGMSTRSSSPGLPGPWPARLAAHRLPRAREAPPRARAWRRCPRHPRSPAPGRAPPPRPGRHPRVRAHAAQQSRSRHRPDLPRPAQCRPWVPRAPAGRVPRRAPPAPGGPCPRRSARPASARNSSPPAIRLRICGRLRKKPASGRLAAGGATVTAPAITICRPP